VLPAAARLRDPQLFGQTIRHGRRTGSRTLVLHCLGPETGAGQGSAPRPMQVGLVVSKAVGHAVARNLVKRRIRALVRERQEGLPASGVLVVRANPAAATASYAELSGDFTRCLQKVMTA
jgi:ribonuclease P protein component